MLDRIRAWFRRLDEGAAEAKPEPDRADAERGGESDDDLELEVDRNRTGPPATYW